MDKYKQYIDVQWWNGIEKRDIENWMKNFGTKKKLAELILDNVIFYNLSQMKAYTRFLLNDLKARVYMQALRENKFSYIDDNVLLTKWKNYMDETRFIPAALIEDPTASAYKIIGYWRSVIGRGEHPISTINDIGKRYNEGVRRFILVDDFSGSGEQMQKVLKQKILFNGLEMEVGALLDVVDDIELIIAVYVIHEEAKKTLKQKYPQINIIYVDLLDEDLNFMNNKSSIYEKIDEKKRQEMIDEIKRINENIMSDEEEMQKLSSYVLNVPIVFDHGCPNNALLLLFAHSSNWKQLFKRGIEI
jgi:hypothetical protein